MVDYNRVLVYKSIPSENGVDADFIIGQINFTSYERGTNTKNFEKKMQVANMMAINDILYIPDTINNRIVGFDISTLKNGPHAKYVFGQMDFVTSASKWSKNGEAGARDGSMLGNLSMPKGIYQDIDGHIWISDYDHNRVIKLEQNDLAGFQIENI